MTKTDNHINGTEYNPEIVPHIYRPLCVCAKLLQSCPTLCNQMDYIAHQSPLSLGFSRQEYWSG